MPPKTPTPLKTLYWGVILAAVFAACFVIAVFWLSSRSETENYWVNHTLQVRGQISQVSNLLERAESSQRGYLITGRDAYLRPYAEAKGQISAAIAELGTLTADNPVQQQAIGSLRQLADEKFSEMQATIDARLAGESDRAVSMVETDKGRELMDRIRRLLTLMSAQEDQLLANRQASARTIGDILQIAAGCAFLLICIAGVLVQSTTRRSFLSLSATRDQLAVTNRQLVDEMAQRENAERNLRQAQKMEAIGQLTGGIAHDFNNMLGVIEASLDLMRRRIAAGNLDIGRFVDSAQQATRRAATLTHRLLAFARQQPLHPAPLDANQMISEMSQLLRSTLGEHIRIETVQAAGLWPASADANQLENAILNIAINARDAMEDGGKLTIETANTYLDDEYTASHEDVSPGQYVMIAISDTGMGMPPDVIARAYDPFFTTKATGKGTGLGLSQVYGFVKQSRGHIAIYSELGAGTTVKLYLPRLFGEASKPEETAVGAAQKARPGEVILVVEDDALVRRLTLSSLLELGYTALDTGSAAEALTVLQQRSDITLLLTDVVMPEVNGKKLADQALALHPALKVLFTTGYTPNAIVHGGVLDPGVNLISKPFTLEQLARKVRSVLDA